MPSYRVTDGSTTEYIDAPACDIAANRFLRRGAGVHFISRDGNCTIYKVRHDHRFITVERLRPQEHPSIFFIDGAGI